MFGKSDHSMAQSYFIQGTAPLKSTISNTLLQHFQEETSMNAKLFKAALMGHFVFLRSATKDTQSNYGNYLQQIKARSPRVRSMVWPQSQTSTLSQL